MTKKIEAKFWINDVVYSTLYTESKRGIVDGVIISGDPQHPTYDYEVMWDNGHGAVEPQHRLSAAKVYTNF